MYMPFFYFSRPCTKAPAGSSTGRRATLYVVFTPEQVKSVGNVGTFDRTNPNVRYSVNTGSGVEKAGNVFRCKGRGRRGIIILRGGEESGKPKLVPPTKEIRDKFYNAGLSQDKIDQMVSFSKSRKPKPETYLSSKYIEEHLQSFKDFWGSKNNADRTNRNNWW